ncbi:MAG: ABC transporter substrate-binding protein [Nitrososphaeria archaeon]
MKRKAISRIVLWTIVAVVIVVAVVGGVAAWYVTRPPAPPSAPATINIGFIAPITGSVATFGEVDPWLVPYIQNYINQNMGGIYVAQYGRKIPVNIIMKDDESTPSVTSTVATQLITQDHVVMLIAMHTPASTVPAAAVAEKYGVPCLCVETPTDGWISAEPTGGYHWSYLVGQSFAQFANIYIQIANEARSEHPGQVNNVVAVIGTSDTDGELTVHLLDEMLPANGYQVVDLGMFAPGTTDFTSAILKAKAANATILMGNMVPPDFATFWKQAHELGWVPKVAAVGRAYLFRSNIESMGDNMGYGLSAEMWWYPTLPYTSPLLHISALQWAQLYESETGHEWNSAIGYDLAAFEMMMQVLENAGSLSPQAINQSLATLDMNTIIGPIKMGSVSPDVQQLYARYEPSMLEPQNLGHYANLPVMGGQWVPGGPYGWTVAPIINSGLPIQTYPVVLIPQNPANATPPYQPPYFTP